MVMTLRGVVFFVFFVFNIVAVHLHADPSRSNKEGEVRCGHLGNTATKMQRSIEVRHGVRPVAPPHSIEFSSGWKGWQVSGRLLSFCIFSLSHLSDSLYIISMGSMVIGSNMLQSHLLSTTTIKRLLLGICWITKDLTQPSQSVWPMFSLMVLSEMKAGYSVSHGTCMVRPSL